MMYFCTLFDKNFLIQGLTMYKSLKAHCNNDFHLFIFAFCDKSFEILKNLTLENTTIISVHELINSVPGLDVAQKNRTIGEFCWTCESASILYCIEKYNIPLCTYIDADLFFFSNPKVLLDEIKSGSVLITEHRYTPKYDYSSTSGKYCVQFLSVKNDDNGLRILKWWVNKCIEWCFNRVEEGKFGDQKYLDDWPVKFENVVVLKHLGGGVAPWNVQQYHLSKNNENILLSYKQQIIPVVFYHFHNLKLNPAYYFSLEAFQKYEINSNAFNHIYKPYLKEITQISNELHSRFKEINIINKNIWGDKIELSKFLYEKKYKANLLVNRFFRKSNRYEVGQTYAGKEILSPVDSNRIISTAIVNNEPFMAGRIGALELNYIKRFNRDNSGCDKDIAAAVDKLCTNAGFFYNKSDDLFNFSDVMRKSFSDVSLFGVWFNPYEDYFIKKYSNNNSNICLLRDLEPFWTDHPWTLSLKNKNVLVIHPFVKTIIKQYARKDILFNKQILPNFNLIVQKAIVSYPGNEDFIFPTWKDCLDYMFTQALKTKFDVAIIGCGAYGFPLAAKLKREGKTVIHLGSATQLLFGIRGRRWEKNSLYKDIITDNWIRPDKDEIPVNNKSIENGCYW